MLRLAEHRIGSEYVYLADTARAPFGTKKIEEIRDIALDCVKFLFKKGADVVISACNTAQAALMISNAQPWKNFFGILDIDLPAGLKKVGVLATVATVNSGIYYKKLGDAGVEVIQRPCQELVTAIESFAPDTEIERIVSEAVFPFRKEGVDAIILGCTHFPLVKHIFEKFSGGISVLDPAELLAEKLKKIFPESTDNDVRVTFYVTSDAKIFSEKLKRYSLHLLYTVEEFSWGEVKE
ncbi:hypothetical protein AS159_07315 [Thermotoga sp. Ku-13t]|nr:hypothetical protein AS159_07315 [Thermotoga sp. Ku-13t]